MSDQEEHRQVLEVRSSRGSVVAVQLLLEQPPMKEQRRPIQSTPEFLGLALWAQNILALEYILKPYIIRNRANIKIIVNATVNILIHSFLQFVLSLFTAIIIMKAQSKN